MSFSCDSEFDKKLRHGAAKGFVMLVDNGEVASLTMALQSASSSQQGLDYFVAQHQQGGQRTHPVPGSLIAPRVLGHTPMLPLDCAQKFGRRPDGESGLFRFRGNLEEMILAGDF